MRLLPPFNMAVKRGLPIIVAGLLLDQLSKLAMLHLVELDATRVHIVPFLDFVLVWNRGVSYGLFEAGSLGAQIFLIIFALLVTLLMWHYLSAQERPLGVWAFALIIGGALGNVIDRVVYGAVVDFISLHAGGWYFYVFNIADIWICVGVGLFLLDAIWHRENENE